MTRFEKHCSIDGCDSRLVVDAERVDDLPTDWICPLCEMDARDRWADEQDEEAAEAAQEHR